MRSRVIAGVTASQGRSFAVGAGATRDLHVALVGRGLVGKAFLAQLCKQQQMLESQLGKAIELRCVTSSKKMLAGNISFCDWEKDFDANAVEMSMDKVVADLQAAGNQGVMVDCTASDDTAAVYPALIKSGVHVVTPNKRAGAGPLERYQACMAGPGIYMGEATVGAGLPVMSTLTSLVETGDKVHSIQGILSGTLSYLFNTCSATTPFSKAVAQAAELGFTEPDPREDLSGMDVQRKVTILARASGLDVSAEDVEVDSLVPAALQDWCPPAGQAIAPAFVEALKEFDGEMTGKLAEADAAGEVLRYVGKVDLVNKKVTVKLERFPKSHAFAATQWADNVVVFETERYTPRPLVVQGPGAGADVTAAGVLSDVISIARRV